MTKLLKAGVVGSGVFGGYHARKYAEMDGIVPGFSRLTKPFRNEELAASIAALPTLTVH